MSGVEKSGDELSGVEMSTFGMKIGHFNPRLYNIIYCVIPGVEMSEVEMSGVEMSPTRLYNFNFFGLATLKVFISFQYAIFFIRVNKFYSYGRWSYHFPTTTFNGLYFVSIPVASCKITLAHFDTALGELTRHIRT